MLNPLMPESASVEVEENGRPVAEPDPTPPARTDPPSPDGDEAPPPDEDDAPAPGDDDTGDDTEDAKASEAGKALAARKRGLDGRKQTIQEQINALVRERGEVSRETERGRREREELQREIEQLRGTRDRIARGEAATDEPAPLAREHDAGDDPRDPRPREDDPRFADYAAYIEAVSRWGARQEVRRADAIRSGRAEQSARQRWETDRQRHYSQRYQEFAKANPTFEEEINREDLFLTAPVVDTIKDSPVGPAMTLHLARHPEELARINAIAARRPVVAYGEMKKLEARLELAHSGSTQPAQHSKAPAPIKPVGNATSRSSDGNDIPDETVSDDEHFERMNKRDALLRKRGVNIRKGYGVRA